MTSAVHVSHWSGTRRLIKQLIYRTRGACCQSETGATLPNPSIARLRTPKIVSPGVTASRHRMILRQMRITPLLQFQGVPIDKSEPQSI